MGYVLIGAATSQFSAKAAAALRWKGVPFEDRPATPEVYRDIIEPKIGFAVIPVLLTPDGTAVQDTADIIDHVDRVESGPLIHPATPVQELVSLMLELYADEWLIIVGFHYRWSHDDAWIVAEMGRIAAPSASLEEQAQIGEVIAKPARDAASRFGVSEETMSGLEAHFEGFLADFSDHLRTLPFVLGDRPSLGDFALYGQLSALLRDPSAGEVMRKLAPAVVEWVARVAAARAGAGDLLARDHAPAKLLPILKRQMAEQLPVLADTALGLEEWSKAQPVGARVKRTLGTHEFTVGGRRGTRSMFSFPLWRLQRLQDHYRGLTGEDRGRADDLLDAVGGRGLVDLAIPVRLARRDFRLVIA